MDPKDRNRTTFTRHAGTYRFTLILFGLCDAYTTFQRMLDILLSSHTCRSCPVYLEDVIIFSSSLDDHLRHVDEVFPVLRGVGMNLRLEKFHFFAHSGEYLGHVTSPGLLEASSRTTDAVAKAKPPQTQVEVPFFLGLCNVYRRFVTRIATVGAPSGNRITLG